MNPSIQRRRWLRLTSVVPFIATILVFGSGTPAHSDGTPDISVQASTPGGVLYGSPITVTMEASNPTGTDGFNLSFQDVLPVGVSYVGGSADPGPTIVDRGDGTTALIWSNLSDLLAGAPVSFSYQVEASPATYAVGDIVATAPGAYVHSDARFIPLFDAVGDPIGASYTGFDTDTTATELLAFELTKSEPNAESELLRGVHDHQTVYTLRVDNNLIDPTTDFAIVDFLPAGLEFLGCGTVDNTTIGEEYPGAGPINPGNAPALTNPCPTPSSVTTVTTDPDDAGPMPTAVYTRVEWDAATLVTDLAPGASFLIDYVAAITLRENVQASLADPTANLDNNSGALTADEQAIVNYAVASGMYAGTTPSSASDTFVVSAEDVSIHKSVDTGSFVQGSASTWTLLIENSEYALSTGPITVTDTIPDGLDFDSATPAQDGGLPVTNGDGTLTVQWTLSGFGASSSTTSITFDTTTRADYRASGVPVSANDTWTNTVALAVDATVITANGGSTSVLPIVDESSASQSAGGLDIVKEVSEPVAGDLVCGDGFGVTFVPVVAGDYRPGDRVCWRLTVNFPGSLDTLDAVVQDFLPAGFEYESWQVGANDSGVAAAAVFGDTDPLLSWTLVPAVDESNTFEAVVQSVITDPTVAVDGQILSNLMKFRYQNVDGSVFQLRDEADATWAEPELTLVKGVVEVDNVAVPGAPVDDVIVQIGEIVTYQVSVDNAGSVDALSVDVRDVLPDGITCTEVSTISNGGTCNAANDWIEWGAGLGLTAPAGGSLALTYDVTVPAGTAAETVFDNVAGVRTFEGDTNDPGNPTFQFVPSSNIDPSLEASANAGPADDTSRIRTGAPVISKSRTTSVTESGNTANQTTIGETITYTVTVDLPGGTAYYGPAEIVDIVNSRLDVQEGSLVVTLDGGALAPGFTTDDTGNTITITFPGNAVTPYEVATDAPQQIVATFDSVVREDMVANVRPSSVPNQAAFSYDDDAGNSRGVNASVSTQIVEPNLTLAKTNDDADGVAEPGQTITYTVTPANANGTQVSTAHDIEVVDTVPADLIVLEAPGDPAEDNDTIAPNGGTWDATARTITWTVASIAPGATAPRSYQVQTEDPLLASGPLTNNVQSFATSLAGAFPLVERDGHSTAVAGYTATATDTVEAPSLSIAKSGTPDAATVGETITYTLDVTIPADVVAYDVTVIDDLPPGIAYESTTSISCSQGGGACAPDITSADVTSDGDVVSFFLGDLTTPATEQRDVTIVYAAYVDDVAAATAGAALVNGATAFVNLTDQILVDPPTPPEPADFDQSSNTATDTVAVDEPSLSIDKDVTGQVADTDTRRAKPGDVLEFTVTVTNASGAAVGDAHDITVSDTPDSRLTDFANTAVAGVTNTDGDPSDGDLEWTVVGPLAPGASVTLTYTLTVPNGFDSDEEVPVGAELTNTADVPSYLGTDIATRTGNPGRTFRDYDDVSPDTVSVELDLASIGDFVWFDVDGDGVQDAGEPPLAGIDVTVTYLGANGVVGGGDDESVTVTTDADGLYVVDRLPGGNYIVDVDEADTDLPAGLVPRFDLDGTTVSPDGRWVGALGQAQDRRDIDFGYTGTGSIGDTIWFDQDGDGVQDAGEAGIADVDVNVTWLGPDGAAGGGDDVVYTTTTAANGTYRVDLLPAGNFVVAVQTLTLPTGYTIVSDPDGGPDGSSAVTLGAGAVDLDQDFGYRGSGVIGDTIYLDRDGDGSQDPTDPGLAGITMQLVHHGPDGTAGNGDDSTFTTTTDSDGNYAFGSLPPGGYTVSVTGGLPANAVNSDDPDGGADDSATLTLADGASDLDQDFGYDADSVLGDRVWWDRDGDGVQDPGEPGLDGVTVTATGPNGLTLITTTTGDGNYLFVDIPDGDWTVTITAGLPAGFSPTFDADGGDDETSDLTLATSDLNQDFGYAGDSTIGDRVWLDSNSDGVQDAGEPGIENLTVELTWFGTDGVFGGGDDVVLTTETDSDGNYLFGGLPAGVYSVAIDQTDPDFSTGLAPTYDRDGTTLTPDGITPVTLGASDDVDDIDFGYRGGGAIGDLVWFDRDGDGTQDADEPGLAGVDVELVWYGEDGVAGGGDDETFNTTTDADGAYSFAGLPSGTFVVTVDAADLPAGMAPSFDADGGLDNTTTVMLADGAVDLDQDFGYRGAGAIGDTVYLDLDGNGIQDPGEPGIPGQTVTVAWDGPAGPVVFTTVTDATGNYLVDGLPDGYVTVTVVDGIAAAAANTGDPDGGADSTSTVTLAGGSSDLDQDFGFRGINAIGDRVWWDRDADGALDTGETGLGGVDLTLTWFGVDGARGGGDDLDFTTQTNAGGNYLFADLPDGSYHVEVTGGLPAGLDTSTYDEDDGTSGPDGTTIVADLGVGSATPVVHLTADFAFAGIGSIGDTVWLDLDGDGTRDAGEPGIPGVTVILTWAGPDADLGTTDDVVYPGRTTDSGGNYLFEDLPAGEFRVALTGVPAGLSTTADPDGGAAHTATLTLDRGETDLGQDFGYVGNASVGDLVWLDVDADGQLDAGEPGLPGVVVVITSPGSDGVLGTADDIVVETVTDSEGNYLVTGVPGVNTMVAYNPAGLADGLLPSSDLDGGNPTSTIVALDPGDDVRNVDFAVIGNASLSGVVFDDPNGNGVQDPGEAGLPDVDVVVVWHGPNGPVTLIATTDANGRWQVVNIPSGVYTATVDVSTLRDGDVVTTLASISVTVPPGGSRVVEHGATAGASLGDRIWNDIDRDGVQDPGEPGIAGVRVTLRDATGTEVASTLTDAEGRYFFDNLVPGSYTVAVDTSTVPAGWSQTRDPDSTIDAAAAVTLSAGENNLTFDFGFAAARATAPSPTTPTTGIEVWPLLRMATLLMALGAALVAATHKKRPDIGA